MGTNSTQARTDPEARILRVRYALSSPLVMSGHNQGSAELRPTGVIAMVAFWWRALAWNALSPKTPQKLARKEAELFGSAETGQGLFLVKRCVLSEQKSGPIKRGEVNSSGIDYLAGLGLDERKQIYCAAKEGSITLELDLLIRPRAATDHIDGLVKALIALGLLGGIGARSRRAFGSLSLRSIEGVGFSDDGPTDKDALRAAINDLIPNDEATDDGLPPYSALSPHAAFTVIDLPGKGHRDALNWLGHHYQLFRAYGHKGNGDNAKHMIGGEPALHVDSRKNYQPDEYRFKDDHDWFKQCNKEKPPQIRRAAFGLPLPFSKTVILNPEKEYERRASPLFLHLHQFGEKHHAAVVTLLAGDFLPDSKSMLKARGDEFSQPDGSYEDIRAFLTWLEGKAPKAKRARHERRRPGSKYQTMATGRHDRRPGPAAGTGR
ncbi:MAG: RAMP superfamily CRISPR-associated protein [Parvularcula sp.]